MFQTHPPRRCVQILFRCALLCKAALEAPWHVPCGGVPYGDSNLAFIANDWHTALLPLYLQVHPRAGPSCKAQQAWHSLPQRGRSLMLTAAFPVVRSLTRCAGSECLPCATDGVFGGERGAAAHRRTTGTMAR